MPGRGRGTRTLARPRVAAMGAVLAGALLTSAAVAERASARAATYCVKASKVKPPKPAATHFTGKYRQHLLRTKRDS